MGGGGKAQARSGDEKEVDGMPQRIDVDPVRGLKEAIDELSTASASVERRIDSLGLRFEELGDLLDSDTIKKLDRYRSTQRTVSGLRGLVRDVDAYARAERMMARHPGSWRNADEVIAWEGRLRERNRSLFRRHQSANDHIMRIKDPERWHGIELSRKYGASDAFRILNAEAEAAEKEKREDERSRWRERKREGFRRFKYDQMSDFEREVHDLTERYGGGSSGRRFAMKSMQTNAYRQFPWMKTLVDAGIIEKKEIPKISKNLAKMSKAPIVGKFLQHPSLLPLAALGVATSVLSQSDRANPVVQRWSAASEIYGDPSRRFDRAARLAGFGSKEAVNKLYARLVGEYGEAGVDSVMTYIGASLRSAKPGIERDTTLKAFKMDAQMGRAAMFMAGLAPSESDITAAYTSRLEDEIIRGFSSDSGLYGTLRSLWLSMGGKWVESRSPKLLDDIKKIPTSAFVSGNWADAILGYLLGDKISSISSLFGFDTPEKAKAAAESLEAVESAGNSISSVTNGGDTTVSFSIGNLEINANDAQALAEELIKVGSGRSGLDIMEAFDRKEIA